MAVSRPFSCTYYRLVHVFLLFLFVKSQETPSFDVPNWSTNVSHRTNFCPLHEAVANGQIERRNALRGLNISVGIMRYQLNPETGAIDPENPNIAMEMLDHIAAMAGFTYRESFGAVDSPVGNETWTDVLYWTVGVYDLMGEWYVETVDRLSTGNALFPEGWYDGNFIMVQRHIPEDTSATVDLFAWTTPFTPGLWGLIAATTLASGFVYYILDFFDSRICRKPMDVTLEKSLYYAAFSFNGHYTHEPKSRGTRLLVFSMAFFFLIIVAAYTANLASFLVRRSQPLVINSIHDVIRHELIICLNGGSAVEAHLQTYRIPKSRLVLAVGYRAAYTNLLEGRCDILLSTRGQYETFRRDATMNPYCDLEAVGGVVKFESAGFAVGDSERHCTSLLRDVLHLYILEMKDNEMFDLIWTQYRERAATTSCIDFHNEDMIASDSMGINNLSGMFVLHCLALVVALLSTLLNFCLQPYERKRRMLSDVLSSLRNKKSLNRVSFTEAGGISRMGGFVLTDPSNSPMVGDTNSENDEIMNMQRHHQQQQQQQQRQQQQQQQQKQQPALSSANNLSSVEKEITGMSASTAAQSSLSLELLRKTIEESNQRHREEMIVSNQRHHEEMNFMRQMMQENNRRHAEEIKQIHQQHRDEMQQSYNEHREKMENFFVTHIMESNSHVDQRIQQQQTTTAAPIASKTLGVYEWRE